MVGRETGRNRSPSSRIGGVCYSLTGDEFQNCELRTLDFHTELDVGNGDFQKFDVFLQDNIWGQIGRALVSFKNKLF